MERIRFYFDIVCPYSYMESRVVEDAEDAGRIEVEWLPFELRPAPKALLEVRGDHLRPDSTQHVNRFYCERVMRTRHRCWIVVIGREDVAVLIH